MNQFPATFPGLDVSAPPPAPGPAPPGPATFTSRAAWTLPAFFVDPSNSSGVANDANTGLTALTPILTTAEFNRRIFMHDVTVASVVTYMSDDGAAVQVDLSTVSLTTGSLTFQGTPVVTHTGGTINAGTIAINPAAAAGGQRQVVHTTDLATFQPYVFTGLGGLSADPQLLVDTQAGANLNTSAWIVSDTAPAAPSMSRPVTPAFGAGALTIGDTYKIQRGSRISRLSHPPPAEGSYGLVTWNDFAFKSSDIGFNGCNYNRCSFQNYVGVDGTYTHCYFGSEMLQTLPMGTTNFNSGVFVVNGFGEVVAPVNFSGDAYITGSQFVLSPIGYNSIFISGGIGSGIQVQDMSGEVWISEGQVDLSGALMWGNGNLIGLLIGIGGHATVGSGAAIRPTVTGALGDFAYSGQNGGAPVFRARPWNEAAGTYGPSINTTWVNFAAPAPAFAFQAHNPSTRASLVAI